MGDVNSGALTITGLNPIAQVICEDLDISNKITINGDTPASKQFLGYNPATNTTIYQDIDPASDLDINSLASLNTPNTASDQLIIYDSATQINKKITPNNLIPSIPTYTAGSGLSLSNQNQFSFSGNIGSTDIISSGDITLSQGTMKAQEMVVKDEQANETGRILFQDEYGATQITIQTPNYNSIPSAYSLTLPTSDGTPGQSLTTQGTGILYWTTPSTAPTYTAGTGLALNGTQFDFTGVNIYTTGSVKVGGITKSDGMYEFPIEPPGYDDGQYRKIQIRPTEFVPNDDNSYYNLGLIDGSPNANTLYGFLKPMTSSLECYTAITIPEGYKIVSFKIFLRSTTTYTNVLRTCTAYKGNMSNASNRYNLIYQASSPYTNYEVQFTASSPYNTFSEEEYLILGVSTNTSSEAIGGGWVKVQKA